mmetsp:Transcript_16377/g.34709  ORF Transcript_16377/g.34709 Transcript_16377/m.34709 type:complete len:217 (-) Transcript_16377:2192-2842(-)
MHLFHTRYTSPRRSPCRRGGSVAQAFNANARRCCGDAARLLAEPRAAAARDGLRLLGRLLDLRLPKPSALWHARARTGRSEQTANHCVRRFEVASGRGRSGARVPFLGWRDVLAAPRVWQQLLCAVGAAARRAVALLPQRRQLGREGGHRLRMGVGHARGWLPDDVSLRRVASARLVPARAAAAELGALAAALVRVPHASRRRHVQAGVAILRVLA